MERDPQQARPARPAWPARLARPPRRQETTPAASPPLFSLHPKSRPCSAYPEESSRNSSTRPASHAAQPQRTRTCASNAPRRHGRQRNFVPPTSSMHSPTEYETASSTLSRCLQHGDLRPGNKLCSRCYTPAAVLRGPSIRVSASGWSTGSGPTCFGSESNSQRSHAAVAQRPANCFPLRNMRSYWRP